MHSWPGSCCFQGLLQTEHLSLSPPIHFHVRQKRWEGPHHKFTSLSTFWIVRFLFSTNLNVFFYIYKNNFNSKLMDTFASAYGDKPSQKRARILHQVIVIAGNHRLRSGQLNKCWRRRWNGNAVFLCMTLETETSILIIIMLIKHT